MPVLIGLGANLGDMPAQLARAVRGLREGGVRVEAVSSLWRTAPVGYDGQPDFLNVVLLGRTSLSARELLGLGQALEAKAGRVRTFPNAPRRLDVDLLALGDAVVDEPDLAVPHPGIPSRAFVLRPLVEVAPDWVHPVLGRTARELLDSAQGLERADRVGPFPPER